MPESSTSIHSGSSGAAGASLGDARPMPAENAIREVFLSPRVIDQGAFTQYAAELRRLIEEAGLGTTGLLAAAADAGAVRDALRELAGKAQPKLDAAGRALSALEARAAEADRSLQRAADLVGSIDQRAAAAARELEARAAEAAQRLAGVQEAGRAKLEALHATSEERLRQLAQRFEREQQALEAAFAQRERELRAQGDRVETALREQTEQVARRTLELLAQCQEKADETLRQVDARIAQSWTHANEVCRSLEAASDRARALIGQHQSDPNDPTCVAGLPGSTPTPAHSIAALLDRAERLHQDATFAINQIEVIRLQAEQARGMLGESINVSATKIDELSATAERLRGVIDQASDLARDAEARIAQRHDEAQRVLAGPAEAMSQIAEQIRLRLAAGVDEARASAHAADACAAEARGLLDRLGAALATLEPWRSVLLEARPGAALPPVIAEMVRSVRHDLGRDMARVASALHQITTKAAQTAERLASDPDPM
ncbi:MAG: hypothetical protein C0475_08790 [Planctomyces sp.]|nr:hypothetical protein [Planctomyces sp.]MBA4038970.1 hypothetical protein [Planctomyces sp.]MBA4120336.1 hypothetical protein [Isosphaera sp.]